MFRETGFEKVEEYAKHKTCIHQAFALVSVVARNYHLNCGIRDAA